MKDLIPRGFTVWFTGLPCSGKTSLSQAVSRELKMLLPSVEHLDGDVMRQGISKDLGFSKQDRATNIERVTYLARMLTQNGVATLVSFVSPYRETRDKARSLIHPFIEIYVRCPIQVCEKRDVKGMYAKARAGLIENFTGIDDPYEEPLDPELIVDTDRQDLRSCARSVMSVLEDRVLVTQNPFPENESLSKAFHLALKHHFGQTRRGGQPYITHPVAVAKMLHDAGYSADVVAAGLLHDVLEDSGCEFEEMVRHAGEKVARIVAEVTDRDKTLSWGQRKQAYQMMLLRASEEGLAVACADKAHNVESLTEGLRSKGGIFMNGFSGPLNDKLENYETLYRLIAQRSPSCRLLPRYQAALASLKSLSS